MQSSKFHKYCEKPFQRNSLILHSDQDNCKRSNILGHAYFTCNEHKIESSILFGLINPVINMYEILRILSGEPTNCKKKLKLKIWST